MSRQLTEINTFAEAIQKTIEVIDRYDTKESVIHPSVSQKQVLDVRSLLKTIETSFRSTGEIASPVGGLFVDLLYKLVHLLNSEKKALDKAHVATQILAPQQDRREQEDIAMQDGSKGKGKAERRDIGMEGPMSVEEAQKYLDDYSAHPSLGNGGNHQWIAFCHQRLTNTYHALCLAAELDSDLWVKLKYDGLEIDLEELTVQHTVTSPQTTKTADISQVDSECVAFQIGTGTLTDQSGTGLASSGPVSRGGRILSWKSALSALRLFRKNQSSSEQTQPADSSM